MKPTYRQLNYLSIALIRLICEQVSQFNEHLAAMEQKANAELARLRQEQVDHDQHILDHWKGVNEELWNEQQELEAKLRKAQMRRKEAKRMGRTE